VLIHQLPLDAAFQTLRSAPTGLSRAEAAARRLEFGFNRIERLPQTALATRFLRQFTHFFAVLLWIAAGLALMADHWMPGQGMATLAVAIIAVIVINGTFPSGRSIGPKRRWPPCNDCFRTRSGPCGMALPSSCRPKTLSPAMSSFSAQAMTCPPTAG
jgi:hypothetical protein